MTDAESRAAEILGFIHRFTDNGRASQVIDAFTGGCCYWFAHILRGRFPASHLVYDEVENHFAVCVDGRVYDITGDVTGQYDMKPWDALGDTALRRRIRRDCINFGKE